jgi:soluble lytic murein transglycosylase-like protein
VTNKPATRNYKKKIAENAEAIAKRKLRKPRARKEVINEPTHSFKEKLLFITIEAVALTAVTIYAIISALGYTATWFSGTGLLSNLLPFATGVLALILVCTLFYILWWHLRKYLHTLSPVLIPVTALTLVLATALIPDQNRFFQSISQFRTLVGGKQEASRVTLNHQVFAAYRRYNLSNLNKMIQRAENYHTVIAEAATEFDVDQNLLQGIAAAESSFKPRDSDDGGHGLFQITAVPDAILEEARERLGAKQISVYNHRHNAYLAAATFKHYLAEMKNDVFLGLLAYNIGPANGGLRFIMQKYGVTDFITIQPYLQLLPRDYPIRVLSYALAFKLWDKHGKLPAYEEGGNAMEIQRVGVPGLM